MELFLGFLLLKPSWLIQKEAWERKNIHALSDNQGLGAKIKQDNMTKEAHS